jgi:hypothetical protein
MGRANCTTQKIFSGYKRLICRKVQQIGALKISLEFENTIFANIKLWPINFGPKQYNAFTILSVSLKKTAFPTFDLVGFFFFLARASKSFFLVNKYSL